jgi:hypothetical protein
VSDPSPLLDRAGIEEAFRRLGERLAKRGVVALIRRMRVDDLVLTPGAAYLPVFTGISDAVLARLRAAR